MSMYVLEGVGSIMPVTQAQVQQITAARAQALRAQGRASGFGVIDPSTIRPSELGPSQAWYGTIGPALWQGAGDFMGTWGVPLGVGLGALAIGLVMAKTIRKRKKGAR